ncbi:LysR family transcriptional regulator [Novipirellula sp.]|uniref:LysR family transcriptional regulator n=1 Tax=Novipirellula sp. TaxID=2795430 RepID=UPI00356B1A84
MKHSSGSLSRASELSVQQLQTFRCVYERGGYAAAAREMELSVPTVWQHIQTLQRLYRTDLFEKSGRGVVATAMATKLYSQVTELLAGLDSTFDLAEDNESDSRPITIVAGVRMMMEEIANPLQQFRQTWNNPLVLREGNNQIAEELILSGEADLALTLEPENENASPLIHFEPAYLVEFLAICKKGHPFAASPSNTLRELVKHDLVVTRPGTHGRDALDHTLHRERLTANVVAETDNSGFTIACVRSGLGVGVLAGRVNGELCRRLVVKSLRRHLGERQIAFMWKKGRRLSPAVQSLVDNIKQSNVG